MTLLACFFGEIDDKHPVIICVRMLTCPRKKQLGKAIMKYSNNVLLAAAIAAASSQTLANGLALNEQSASSAGSAYAGRASSAANACSYSSGDGDR